jgi:hypothetical protein
MSDGRRGPALRGRAQECEALDRLLAGVPEGQGQVLVLRGEAGVGKSALLDYVGERAGGCRLVRAAGVESEGELAFAGLHQLCAPLLDEVGRLPEPQRAALSVAFGLDVGPAPDRFLVGLALLGLVSAVAEERPLVCVVDDAQWLDQASAQALGFAARRLLAESVALVFAVREPIEVPELAGLPELDVRGLCVGAGLARLELAEALGALTARFAPPVVEESGPIGGVGAPDWLRARFPRR